MITVTSNSIETNCISLSRTQLKEMEARIYNNGQITNYSLWLFIEDLIKEIDSRKE